jgi:hypothetical protein
LRPAACGVVRSGGAILCGVRIVLPVRGRSLAPDNLVMDGASVATAQNRIDVPDGYGLTIRALVVAVPVAGCSTKASTFDLQSIAARLAIGFKLLLDPVRGRNNSCPRRKVGLDPGGRAAVIEANKGLDIGAYRSRGDFSQCRDDLLVWGDEAIGVPAIL